MAIIKFSMTSILYVCAFAREESVVYIEQVVCARSASTVLLAIDSTSSVLFAALCRLLCANMIL